MSAGLGRRRLGMVAVVAVAAVVVALLAVPGPARAAPSDEARLLALSNGVRASAGAPALVLDESLSAVARAWAAKVAAAGTLSHNPNLSSQVPAWTKVAENVGMGPDVDTVHRALLASPPHHANLVDPALTHVGFGVATAGGTVFVVEDFLRPSGAMPTPPPVTTQTSTTTRATTPAKAVPTTAPFTTAPRTTRAPAPVAPPPTTSPAPAPPAEPPSPWLALALELTRSWEGTGR